MVNVILDGWNPGLEKVQLGKLLQKYADFSLADSKVAVDRLLNNEPITVGVNSAEKAQQLIEEAASLGVHCRIDDLEALNRRCTSPN